MIKSGDKVKFTMPLGVYNMMKPKMPDLQQVRAGVAVSDEDGNGLVQVNIDDDITALAAKDLEVIE